MTAPLRELENLEQPELLAMRERKLPSGFPIHRPHWQDCANGTCECER